MLDNVTSLVKPGRLTALMGASGCVDSLLPLRLPLTPFFARSAGKTTLLDTVSQRKTTGKVEGRFLIDGKPLGAEFSRRCAFCMQADVHEPLATCVTLFSSCSSSSLTFSFSCSVRECIQFSALLRQDASISREDKLKYAEEVIELLELQEIADAIVGNPEIGGLGIEEKKRLTIAVEVRKLSISMR